MTITSQEELQLTQRRIAELELALSSARRRLGEHPQTSAVLVSSHQRQLRKLRDEISEFLGITMERDTAYEIRFGTGDEDRGPAPLSVLEKVVGDFKDAVTSIAEKLSTGKARKKGRPIAEIARLVDFRVVGIAPGSVRLLLEPPLQQGLPGVNLADKAFSVLEDTATWVGSGAAEPPSTLGDESLRELALKQIQRLAPTEWDQVSWVELSGRNRQTLRPSRLTPGTYHRVAALLKKPRTERVEIIGKLREIDLDKGVFELRPRKGLRQKCKFPADFLRDALNFIESQALVVVRGTRSGNTLNVVSIRPAN